MEILTAMKTEYMAIINDIKKHPSHIEMYDLEAIYEALRNEENKQLFLVIETEIDIIDNKICEISPEFCNYKKQETLLIKKVKDRNIRYQLEECINNKNDIYSKHLYIEAFSKGFKAKEREQVLF